MAFLPTNASQVQQFAVALYGIKVGSSTMAAVQADITAVGGLNNALNAYYAVSFGSSTTAAVGTSVAANLGLTGTAATDAAAYITAVLNGTPANARGAAIQGVLNLFSTLTSNATFGAAAAAWNNKVAAAIAYTGASDVVIVAGAAVDGLAFTLSTNIENTIGTAGNDTFNAANSTATAANATFTTPDSIDGGDGVDTLNITGSAAGSTVTLGNVKNVEIVNLYDTTGVTASLTGSSGVTTVNSNGSTTAPTFTGIASTAVGLGVANSAVGATFTFATAAVAGAADTATLTLNGQTAGTNVVAGVETLNIVSSGSANAVTALTTANATKFVTSGNQTLNLATLPATVFTVDSSAATAGVTYTVPNNATAATLTGGSGNDSITMTGGTAVNDKIDLGAGNDTITFTANLANTDTVAGGDGTDKLASTSALLRGLTIATANAPIITGFETLSFTDDLGANTITAANVQAGIANVELQVAVAAAGTVVFEAGAHKVTQTAAQGAGITVNDTGTATTDSLTFDIAAATGAVNVFASNITTGGFETVNIVTTTAGTATKTTQAMGTITATPDTGGAQVINFSGDNSVSTGVITVSGATSGTVDASGLTGTRTFTNVGATVGVTNIIGSANADTIVGSATATTISGGAGNDNITGGAAADSIDAGAGNDTITGGGGNDKLFGGDGNDSITQGAAGTTTSIDGGAGNDSITLSGFIASTQKINGGDGTDTLIITTADVATINAFSFNANTAFNANITNIEKLQFADALTANPDLSRIAGITTVVSTADNGGNDTITGLANGSTLEFGITQTTGGAATMADATGTNDSITVSLNASGTVAMGTFTVTGVENATISATDTDTTATAATADAAHTITFVDTAAKSITVTGNSLSLGLTLTGDVAVTNLDASAYKGALTTTLVSTVNATMTGGAGNDVLTGSGKSDSINGGAGSDTIAGGLGADVLDGGTGANTLDASGMVGVADGGTVTSTGAIINFGASAIAASTVSSAQLGTAKSYISGSSTSIAAGTAGYLFGSNSASADSAVDTISNFTKITGTTGADYIVGNATGAQTITGGTGADYMVGGAGADTYVAGAATTSVVKSASSLTGAGLANNDTWTFGNGVDVISNFVSGTDKLDVATAATAATSLMAFATGALTNNTTYSVLGTYDAATQVFTINSAATASTANVATLVTVGNGVLTETNNTGYVVLVGVTSLVAADFV